MKYNLNNLWSKWTIPLVLALAGAGTSFGIAATYPDPRPQEPDAKAKAGIEDAKDLSSAFKFVASKLRPSVVSIQTKTEVRQQARNDGGRGRPQIPGLPPEFERFFGDDTEGLMPRGGGGSMQQQGQGTGVIVGEEGVIVTNNHVIRGAQVVTVVTSDNKSHTAKVIGADPKTDIAVLKIEAKGLKAAKFGSSDASEVGDWVVAVGSPFGLDQTVTAGIVSAKGRSLSLSEYEDFIQTDAAINPGNSGGPLLNLKGEIVGINTAIASRSGGYNGVGFAIPSKIVETVVHSLTTNGGVVKRGKIGVGIQDLDEKLAKTYNYSNAGGALVNEVLPGGPADKAGLKADDIVTKFNGKEIGSSGQFRSYVATTEPGQKVDLEVFRDGKPMNFSVTLAQLEADVMPVANRADEPAGENLSDLGVAVQEANPTLSKKYGLPESAKGVVVTYVDENSLASQVGIRAGDMIVGVGKTTINSVEDYRKAMSSQALKDGVRLALQTKEGRRMVFVQSN
jgi:serine protease Do